MHICPVCGYSGLLEDAYDKYGYGSYEICPCCGYEFGYTEQYATHEEYREKWLNDGAKWWSKHRKKPQNWSLEKQIENQEMNGEQ